jgi:hypothetical protein
MDVPGIHELVVQDLGGSSIDPQEMVNDELVGWLTNLSTDLGTPADPHFNEYQSFMAEINDAKIITLSADELKGAGGKYDDLDLNADQSVEDLSKAFLMFMGMALFRGQGVGPEDCTPATVIQGTGGRTFAPFEEGAEYGPCDNYSIPVEA